MIIGSTALEYFGLNRSEPKDLDVFVTEFSPMLIGTDSHKIPDEIFCSLPEKDGYLTPSGILTLKMSHLQWDNHWWKTFQDILWLKIKHNIEFDEALYYKLVHFWKTVHGNKSFLSLEKTKEDFFTDKVSYPMDHDLLHEKVAYPDEPVYKKCLKSGKDVAIDKSKFDLLDFDEQVKMFKEEISVIALERYLLNENNSINSIIRAYQLALKKTITNLTKNWASDFIIFNLEKFVSIDYKMFYNVLLEKRDSKMLEQFKEFLISSSELDGEYYSVSSYLCDIANNYVGNDEIEVIEQAGGGEGGSEYCYAILKWKDSFFKVEYSYYSFEGFNYDDIFESMIEVKPKEKTITVYV